jgi:hypothetical protein
MMHTIAISIPDIKFFEGAGVVVGFERDDEFVVLFVNACEIIKRKHNVIVLCFSISMIIKRTAT